MGTSEIHLGLDPGGKGALAVWPAGVAGYPLVFDCPPDEGGMRDLLAGILDAFPNQVGMDGAWAYQATVEKVWLKPGWGRGKSLIKNFDYWCAYFTWNRIPIQFVPPTRWQRMVRGERGRTAKERAWRHARRRFPHLGEQLGDRIPKADSRESGRADALCILDFGKGTR